MILRLKSDAAIVQSQDFFFFFLMDELLGCKTHAHPRGEDFFILSLVTQWILTLQRLREADYQMAAIDSFKKLLFLCVKSILQCIF